MSALDFAGRSAFSSCVPPSSGPYTKSPRLSIFYGLLLGWNCLPIPYTTRMQTLYDVSTTLSYVYSLLTYILCEQRSTLLYYSK